jgi:hypothetical protein
MKQAVAASALIVLALSFLLAQSAPARFNQTDPALDNSGAQARLDQRPLNLPVLRTGGRCPISKGSPQTVPHVPYIFCSACVWFGQGPAYFALTFHDMHSEDATLTLETMPHEDGAYRAKTPWVSKPDYSGPILIRGRQLDAKGVLRFRAESPTPDEQLQLDAGPGPNPTHWSFWPTSMYLPGPGCYGLQIDTLQGTDVVVFSATKH